MALKFQRGDRVSIVIGGKSFPGTVQGSCLNMGVEKVTVRPDHLNGWRREGSRMRTFGQRCEVRNADEVTPLAAVPSKPKRKSNAGLAVAGLAATIAAPYMAGKE